MLSNQHSLLSTSISFSGIGISLLDKRVKISLLEEN